MNYGKLLAIGGIAILVGLVIVLIPLPSIINGVSNPIGIISLIAGALLLVAGVGATVVGSQARRRDLKRPRTYGEEFDGRPFEDDRPRNAYQHPGAGIQGQPGAGL